MGGARSQNGFLSVINTISSSPNHAFPLLIRCACKFFTENLVFPDLYALFLLRIFSFGAILIFDSTADFRQKIFTG